MKRLVLFLFAALAIVSCSRDVMEADIDTSNHNPAACRTICFHASELQTKAQFGTPENGVYPTLWTSSDTEAKISLNLGSAVAASVTPSQDGKTSTLSATVNFDNVVGPYTFYAVSPSSAAQALSPSRESWKVTIPCEQTPGAGSVDAAGIILAASSLPYPTSTQIADVDLFFSHLTAYGRLTLTNPDLIPSGAAVQAVELTATTPIVGDWYWACNEDSEGHHTLLDYGASYTVTINTQSLEDVWFACAPVDLSGECMTVRIITDQGVLEKLILFDGEYKLAAGHTAVFSVNMSEASGSSWTAGGSGTSTGGGSGAFTLVTNASELQAGDEVIITNIAGDKALGANTGTYRSAVDITVSNDQITNTGEACILTVAAGLSSGSWAFLASDGYLATSTNKNNLSVSQTITNGSSWTVSISSGNADIVAVNGTYDHLCYNSGSPRFSGYASTSNMPKVRIFRRSSGGSGAVVAASDPLLQETEYGAYLGTGLTWQLEAGVNQVTRCYNSGVLTYTIINEDTVEELEITGYNKNLAKGDPVSISVNWRQGVATVLQADYTMTIVKEAGPKVWISDGNGHGVIIKK